MTRNAGNNFLIVANFAPDTGYAWKTIEEYFFSIGHMFLDRGNEAFICFPEIKGSSGNFQSSGMQVLKFDFWKQGFASLYRLIRRHQIRILYLTDRPVFSPRYALCRIAGVRKIVVHDRTSGERDTPGIIKKGLKTAINRTTLMSADIAIGISDFVKERLIRVSCFPATRTRRIWNGIDIEIFKPGNDDLVFRKYDIPRDKKIIFAYSRANTYKGIQVLIDSADFLINEKKREDLFFLFCGDGPDLDYFRSLIEKKGLNNHFLCPGKTDAIERILKGVSIVVVPSIWREGFGLSVVEGMASGKVVIASRVGGIVEIVTDSRDGFLFSPGESRELSNIILNVLNDEECVKKIGLASRETVLKRFNIEGKKEQLMEVFKNL